MKKWFHLTIQKSLLIALILLSGLVLVSSIIIWTVFERINKEQQTLLTHSLPVMRFADNAADSGGDLLALSSSLSRELSKSDYSRLQRRADFLLTQARQDIAGFDDNSSNFSNTQQLKLKVQQLMEKIRLQLNLQKDILENKQSIEKIMEYLYKRIDELLIDIKLVNTEILSKALDERGSDFSIDNSQKNVLVEMRFEVLRIESLVERLLLVDTVEKVNKEENLNKLYIRKISTQLLSLNESQKQYLGKNILKINNTFLQNNSIFELITVRLNNVNKLVRLKEESLALSQDLNSLYSAISLKANYDVDLGAQSLVDVVETSKLILLMSSIVFLSVVIFLYIFFIRPKVINRLVGLKNNTRAIADNKYDVNIDVAGDDEITAMATSLAYFRDQLIEKDEVQQALADREETLSTVVNNAAEGLFTVDTAGIVQTFNPACESIFELHFDNAIGEDVLRFLPSAFEVFTEHEKNAAGDSYIVCENYQMPAFRADGSEFTSSLSVSLINLSGRYLYSCFVRDITAEQMAKEKIETLVNELMTSNADLERFAYSCSHDLQEPVRMVLSFSDLLKEHLGEEMDEKTAKYLGFITNGAQNAKELIKDILAYSRLDQSSVKKEWVASDTLYEKVKGSIVILQEELNGKFDWDGDDIKINGVESQLVQLLTNLVTNGLKYNHSSEPKVTVNISESDDDWLMTVKDNGIGIDQRYHKIIFEVFRRLVTKREYVGSGIGLSICKKIVEKHHGEIWLESQPGQGSQFFIRLPKSV